MDKVLVQALVETETRKRLDELSKAVSRSRASYICLVLEQHVATMPSKKVLRAVEKAWRGRKS